MSVKFGNIYRWIYGHLTGKTTNFHWVVNNKLAGSGIPTSFREIRWLHNKQRIKSIVTIEEKPLPAEWFDNEKIGKIDYYHLGLEDFGAPPLEELDNVINHIRTQINHGKPVMVHCSGGKGRTGTILAGYLLRTQNGLSAEQAISKLRNIKGQAVESKEQESILHKYEDYLKLIK